MVLLADVCIQHLVRLVIDAVIVVKLGHRIEHRIHSLVAHVTGRLPS